MKSVGACGAECACGVDRCALAEGGLWDSAAVDEKAGAK